MQKWTVAMVPAQDIVKEVAYVCHLTSYVASFLSILLEKRQEKPPF